MNGHGMENTTRGFKAKVALAAIKGGPDGRRGWR